MYRDDEKEFQDFLRKEGVTDSDIKYNSKKIEAKRAEFQKKKELTKLQQLQKLVTLQSEVSVKKSDTGTKGTLEEAEQEREGNIKQQTTTGGGVKAAEKYNKIREERAKMDEQKDAG